MAANPKTLAKEALRWLTIIAAGGFGLWQLADAISHAIRVQWTGDATNGFSVFFLLISLLMAAPFLAVAYFCLRRQYRKLFLVLGVVGGVVIFAELLALPDQLGVFPFHMADRPNRENSVVAIFGLPLALFMLFGPIYGAAWFYRLCHRLACPGAPKRPKTQATHWLIWLGILCALAPTTITMLVTFNDTVTKASPIKSFDSQLEWIIGLTQIGFLLIFLGLVRRQPIPETPQNPASPKTEGA